jgi:translation initiation factor 6
MGIEKLRILGNDYVGAWCTATDKFFITGNEMSPSEQETVAKALGVKGFGANVSNSGLLGIYIAANSRGVLLPHGTDDRELDEIRKMLPDIRVDILYSDYNALKNNILVNDKVAIINPNYSRDEERRISDTLDVETYRMTIAGYHTVGAHNILTNKGIVINNRASEQDADKIKHITGFRPEQSTANRGALSIGICVIANSNGLIVGDMTTGYEMARIAETLDIE